MIDILGPGGLAAIVMDADCDPTSTPTAWSACSWAPVSASWVRRGRVDDDWMDRSLDLIWAIIAEPSD